MIKQSRFYEQQIGFILRQAEGGVAVEEVCRKAGISIQTTIDGASTDHGCRLLPCEEAARRCGLVEIWTPPLYTVGARSFTFGLIWPERSVEVHEALDAGEYSPRQSRHSHEKV